MLADEIQARLRGGRPVHFELGERPETIAQRAARTIPAAWLDALTDSARRSVAAPVDIRNAIIDGTVSWRETSFEGPVSFSHCEIDSLDVSFAVFGRTARFTDCEFGSVRAEGARIQSHFSIDRSRFWNDCNFKLLDVAGALSCLATDFRGTADFHAVKTLKGATWGKSGERHTTFHDRSRFSQSSFSGEVNFVSAQFLGMADLSRIFVDGPLYFWTDQSRSSAEFHTECRFADAHISQGARFRGVRFGGLAHFERIRIDGQAFFGPDSDGAPVCFEGDLFFTQAKVAGIAEFNGSQFLGSAYFSGTTFDGPAFFQAAAATTRFAGETAFRDVVIGGNANFQGAIFSGEANFQRIRIGGALLFDAGKGTPAQFERGAQFVRASVSGECDFSGVHFQGPANFDGVTLSGPARFRSIVCDADLRCVLARFQSEALFHACTVQGEIRFDRARIEGPSYFGPNDSGQKSHFGGTAAFRQVTFGAETNFSGSEFVGAAVFAGSEFAGPAGFSGIQTREGADFTRCSFQAASRFNGSALAGETRFDGAEFHDRVDFGPGPGGETRFGGPARFVQAQIEGEAIFSAARFEADANFDSAEFRLPARFVSIQVRGSFRSVQTTFHSELSAAGARFEGDATFERSRFSGPVSFAGPQRTFFQSIVRFAQASFGGAAFFDGVLFGSLADLYGARFEGPLYMRSLNSNRVELRGGLWLTKAVIAGEADLSGMLFPSSTWQGNRAPGAADSATGPPKVVVADFSRAEFRGGLRLSTRTMFWTPDFHCEARFANVRVTGEADFAGATFFENALFNGAEFAGAARFDLFTTFHRTADFSSCHFKGTAEFSTAILREGASFVAARFEEDAIFDSADFRGLADFTSAEVKYHARFVTAVFQDAIFSDARMNVLHCMDLDAGVDSHTRFNQALDLRGFTYGRIYADWPRLLSEMRMQTYDRQPFTQLETALRSLGHDQKADEVYLERRRRENLNDRRNGTNRIRTAADWAFGVFGGYGVALPNIVASLTGLILLGAVCFLFLPALTPTATSPPFPVRNPPADAFATSIHHLFPVSVGVGESWKPVGAAAAYALVHRLLGSTLLSLGLAALIGLLHRRAK